MADPNFTNNDSSNPNQTMRREQGKAEVSGGGDRQREQGGTDKDRQEKSAIGGQAKSDEMSKDKSQTGEPGRARNELDQNRGEFNKSRSEPTGQR